MIHTKKSKLYIILAFIMFVSAVLFFCGNADIRADDNVSVGEIELKDVYIVGEIVDIPDALMTADGKTESVEPVVRFPNGSLYRTDNVELTETGKYSVRYTLKRGNINHTETKDFYVYDYIAANGNTPLRYYANELYENTEGLNFELLPNEVVKYNRIINLKEKTIKDRLICIDATPLEKGKSEARDLLLTLTDIYDSSNYVTIRIRRAPQGDGQSFSYVSASHGNNPLSGWYKTTLYQGHPNYGTSIKNGLRGEWGYSDGTPDVTCHIEVYFDYSEKALYINTHNDPNGRQKVVDLAKDFGENAWAGFTTGEVFLSIKADTYESATAMVPFHGTIMSIYDYELNANIAEDGSVGAMEINTVPFFEIDFDQYSEKELPSAMVGYPYKIFGYNTKSLYGYEKLITRVFYGYNSSFKYQLQIKDGAFTPIYDGIYTIEYEYVDKFGNSDKKLVHVNAIKTKADYTLTVPNCQNYANGTVGLSFDIQTPESVEAENALGRIDVSITAKHKESGETVSVEGTSFVPYKAGDWEITYYATDYVGRKASFSYDASVDVGDKVIFGEIKDIPEYFIVRGKNIIPDAYVTDYTSGTAIIKKAENVFVERNGTKVADVTEGYFIPDAEGEYTVVYSAVSSYGEYEYKRFTVTAVDTGFNNNNNLNFIKYFYPDKPFVSAYATSNQVAVTVNEATAIDFIRPLDAVNFVLTFNIGEKNAASKVLIELRDANNSAQRIKLALVKASEGVELVINDRKQIALDSYKFGKGADFTLSLSGGDLNIGKVNIAIKDYLGGGVYNGFDSLLAYMTITTEYSVGSSGETELIFKEINGQAISDTKRDRVEPRIVMSEGIKTSFLPNETVKIGYIKLSDVIDPYGVVTLTVMDPEQNIVKDINGVVLEEVDPSKDYYIKPDKIGYYRIYYKYSDSQGNGTATGKGPVFSVKDRNAPVITLSKTTETVKVGDTVTIASATVTDAETPNEITLAVFLQPPKGGMQSMVESRDEDTEVPTYATTFIAKEKGTYYVKYCAFDAYYNMSVAEFKVVVN